MIQDQINSKQFSKNGYVEISQLISEDSAKKLLNYCQNEISDNGEGFYSSIWKVDVKKRTKDFEIIQDLIWNKISSQFPDYKLVMANFMIKKNNNQSSLGLHQDWTFTEEKKFKSLNIWIPLVDITSNNGPLTFIKHSNKIDNSIRGKNIEQMFEQGVSILEKNFKKSFLTKTGDALIFDTRMIHFSPPNTTDTTRIAISLVIVKKEAELIHYYKKNKSDAEVFKISIDNTYFYKYHLSELPLDIPILDSLEIQPINKKRQSLSVLKIIWHNKFSI